MDIDMLPYADSRVKVETTQIDENISNAPVMKRVNPAVDHDHDYLNDPIRSIMIAEKILEMKEQESILKKKIAKEFQCDLQKGPSYQETQI